jgi:hypothetical protein
MGAALVIIAGISVDTVGILYGYCMDTVWTLPTFTMPIQN